MLQIHELINLVSKTLFFQGNFVGSINKTAIIEALLKIIKKFQYKPYNMINIKLLRLKVNFHMFKQKMMLATPVFEDMIQ